MSERRFTEKPDLNPQAVMSLDVNHAAMRENRTLFPSTVVTVTEDTPDRLLVSGKNNRKIGSTVEKGKFKGYGIYCLSLEERATCPTDCEARGYCYGNGMQMARRHRIGEPDVFYDRLGFEIAGLLDDHAGLLIRLHVLGDFPSVEYVSFWKEVLDEHPNVACFGYTHRLTGEIADSIQAVKDVHPDRFRIRWSGRKGEDGALVANFIPDKPRVDEGLVCPSQTDKTACCATCGLCWENKFESIVFIKHGRMSVETETQAIMAGMKRADFEKEVMAAMPQLRRVAMGLTKNRDDADDLVQETVAKALTKADQFEPGTNLAAWLTTIQRNQFLSGKRKSGREVDDPDGLMTARMTSAEDQGEAVEAREALALLERLPDDTKAILQDIAEGHSYETVAEKHDLAIGTVKSRVSRARDQLEGMVDGSIETRTGQFRAIRPIPINGLSPSAIRVARPVFIDVEPRKLIVETKYQRDLSSKSLKLIKRIVEAFDWTKFKAPVCVESPDGYFVIDGQHTAIAAASHPDVKTIPIMVVDAASIEARASSFVAHNRDRVAMSPAQLFYGEIGAGDPETVEVMAAVEAAGAHIPRNPVPKKYSKIGQVASIGRIQRFYRAHGAAKLTEVLSICTKARCKPISGNIFEAVSGLCTEPEYSGVTHADLITALMAQPNFDQAVIRLAADLDSSRFHAARVLLYRAAVGLSEGRKAAA